MFVVVVVSLCHKQNQKKEFSQKKTTLALFLSHFKCLVFCEIRLEMPTHRQHWHMSTCAIESPLKPYILI